MRRHDTYCSELTLLTVNGYHVAVFRTTTFLVGT